MPVSAAMLRSPLFAACQASTRNESCAFLLVAQMMRIILTPRQYASVRPVRG
jgi:hypothetical protein